MSVADLDLYFNGWVVFSLMILVAAIVFGLFGLTIKGELKNWQRVIISYILSAIILGFGYLFYDLKNNYRHEQLTECGLTGFNSAIERRISKAQHSERVMNCLSQTAS